MNKQILSKYKFQFKKGYFVILFFISIQSISQSITINTTNYKQVIDMIGADIERSSIAIQNAKNKNEIINWGFKDINFNYCRVQYDKHQELTQGQKKMGFYKKQLQTMKQIKQLNPNIKFFATMRTDYNGYGNKNNMPDWIVNYKTKAVDVKKYATFLADYLEFMEHENLAINTLSITKEWTSFIKPKIGSEIIVELQQQCNLRGIKMPKISDQGFWSISQGIKYLNAIKALKTEHLYSSFCTHDYKNEGQEKWQTIIANTNSLDKKLYDDESSTGSGSPTYGSERPIKKQLQEYIDKSEAYKAGLSGEIFFEIWSRGINKETRAIYYPANGEGKRLRGYFIMKQFSNNILNYRYLTSVVNNMPDVYTMAFRKENKIVFWILNNSKNKYEVSVNLDNSKFLSEINMRYWTDSTPLNGDCLIYKSNQSTVNLSLKPESINSYVFRVVN
ncbi:glycoside hydrolase [Neotamlana laminarinivorans]|uniref:Uncharacterized protein n=1 Tax=Neotamlana laminarinivorans TaxID=2883124 RepID=A0A9X1I1D8_9FLAO|nr:hypothetical protein [Tamlana laminarinivorans]MCB4799651.1 hypothetical protein [Tamlana laminarinivorans]